jgi:hypothetical protein
MLFANLVIRIITQYIDIRAALRVCKLTKKYKVFSLELNINYFA